MIMFLNSNLAKAPIKHPLKLLRKVGRDNNILNIYLIQALNDNASRNQQHRPTLHIELILKNMWYNYFWSNGHFLAVNTALLLSP